MHPSRMYTILSIVSANYSAPRFIIFLTVSVLVGAYTGFGANQPGGHMSLNEYAAFDPIFWSVILNPARNELTIELN